MTHDQDDEREIRSVVTRMAHHLDRRRWAEFRALFTDVMQSDYRSLFGGEVEELKADDLVARLRAVLGALDATQHLLGPMDVEVKGKEASAECHVRGYHRLARAPSGDDWMIAGHYIVQLVKEDAGWKIRKMTLEVLYQTGNTKMLAEVGQ